ncbi:hypothetical protein SAMN02745150_00219 [Brevinema andersonii]|uniref:Uncharacterized protein n=1 Tax=Brevinema andersonii TaxID=34097 RepID=A0A1I1D241_BREAD|nr:hypothetical protein [Brevinema andersonii]SFB68847.1 hypothetical protein SAMN02745150_00219 [Brevinema andersonii]
MVYIIITSIPTGFFCYVPQLQKNISPYFQQAIAREIFIPPMENYLFISNSISCRSICGFSGITEEWSLVVFLLALWQVKEIRSVKSFPYIFDGYMQEILQKKRLSSQDTDDFLEEISEVLRKLSDFLNTQSCFNIFVPLLSVHNVYIFSREFESIDEKFLSISFG